MRKRRAAKRTAGLTVNPPPRINGPVNPPVNQPPVVNPPVNLAPPVAPTNPPGQIDRPPATARAAAARAAKEARIARMAAAIQAGKAEDIWKL